MTKDLQRLNSQNKLALWTGRISDCRSSGQSVKTWCKKNNICGQTYYRWQKRLFELAKAQNEVQFAEVPLAQPVHTDNIAITIRVTRAEADIHKVGRDRNSTHLLCSSACNTICGQYGNELR